MAISDINKAMGLYAQPSEFDQNAWKTAFDMADRFAQASEKHRANVENLATQDARLQHQHWEFLNKEKTGDLNYLDKQRQYNNALQTDPSNIQATIAGNQYTTTSSDIARQGLLGQQELTQKLSQYALNPDGTYRSLPEAYAAMTGAGEKLSPYAFSSVYQAGMQQRTNEQAALEGIAANSMETTTDALGNIVPTGRIDPSLFEQKLNQAVATGGIRQATADAFKNQLFPASTTTSTAQPQGMITPAQAQSFSEQFSQINQRLQPITVPFAVGNAPVAEASEQNAAAAVVARPLTYEEKRQRTIDNLNDWQNGGAERYWAEQRAQALANSKAQAQAIGQVMQQKNQSTYPFWLKY